MPWGKGTRKKISTAAEKKEMIFWDIFIFASLSIIRMKVRPKWYAVNIIIPQFKEKSKSIDKFPKIQYNYCIKYAG